MGEIVFAAKVTHVPTMLMSEQEGPIKGAYTLAHHLDSLELEYGSLVQMRFMCREQRHLHHQFRV